MDVKQYGRYFFIDTKPEETNYSTSHHYHHEESRDYESDHIDEEIEHRLYSMIHHHSDDPVLNSKGDGSKSEQQQYQHQSSAHVSDFNKDVQLSEEGDKQIICDSILINLNNKRQRKSQPVSPNKKAKPSTSTSTATATATTSTASTSKTSVTTVNQVNQQTPSIIYLSDSDEDTTTEDLPVINSSTAKRDLWHIDYKDYLISNPVHGKFYRPRIWCSRCKKEGNHPVKLCHLPKHKICYICGGVGHLGQHCQNQHCKRCMDFHSTSHCTLNVREYKCRICNKYGHLDDVCPNHWRKFHNITDPQIDPDSTAHQTQIQKNTNKSCSICGRHQHYSFECERLRNRSIEISSPYDINTTFRGKVISIIRKKLSTTPLDIYPRFQQELRSTPQSTKFFGPRPRYFTSEPSMINNNQSIVDQPNTCGQMIPTSQSQSNYRNNNINRSPKKKPKKKKKKQFKISTDNEMIKGGSIRSGKVKKPKTRGQQQQQQKKKQKKQNFKMQQQLMRQSRQSMNLNHMVYESFKR